MFSKVFSAGLQGIEGYPVQVEADVGNGLPGFHMVGYLASEVREAEDRVRAALKNSGILMPPRKVTVNLSPADVRKGGTAFDLPVAVAVLAAYGIGEASVLKDSAFVGELGLDGQIKPVRGVLSLVSAMGDKGLRRCFLPRANVPEGLAAGRIEIVGIHDLKQMIELLSNPGQICKERRPGNDCPKKAAEDYPVDFSEINGQGLVRRATEVAVAGRHNILYLGPPGSGKSMVAQRIPTIMPSLSQEEQLEISKVYSVCGMLPQGRALLGRRPFRSPHHTISPQAMAGGGRYPKPGEISLASRGVLFLDEFPEFKREALEVLRQPLEERKVTVSRINGTCTFPSNVLLAAAMNPCPCGFYPDRSRCSCNDEQVRRYLGRISRPLLERIDICVETAPVSFEDIRGKQENEASSVIRGRVEQAGEIQRKRFWGSGIFFNSEMGSRQVEQHCRLGEQEEAFMKRAFQEKHLSARGYHKILRVARTIADLDGKGQIGRLHLCEAIAYRDLEEKYWGKGL
ncbi:ATP-binding protein [Clostridiaceae bacterium]|nr:ATP-binding protein [Clostridiaceae bacterium]RKI16797.1 ATP-binding protein [bacterium 1XD21-70]